MKQPRYTVNEFYTGPHGLTCSRRVNMRAYLWRTAQEKADKLPRGFVCRLGSNVPVYVGERAA